MFSEVIEKKAESLARLTGTASGEELMNELLDKGKTEWERKALAVIVADAKASGISSVKPDEFAEFVKQEGRRRHAAQKLSQ